MSQVNEDLAYIAGFVDGEGSIIMHIRRDRKQPYIRPMLIITQANKEILLWILKTLNIGNINLIYQKENRRKIKKDCWNINYGDRKAYEVIKLLRPYIRVKAEQADLLISFYEKYGDSHNNSKEKLALAELNNKLNHVSICK